MTIFASSTVGEYFLAATPGWWTDVFPLCRGTQLHSGEKLRENTGTNSKLKVPTKQSITVTSECTTFCPNIVCRCWGIAMWLLKFYEWLLTGPKINILLFLMGKQNSVKKYTHLGKWMKRTYKYNRCGGVSKGRQNGCVRQNWLFIIKTKLYVLYILYIYIFIYHLHAKHVRIIYRGAGTGGAEGAAAPPVFFCGQL